MSLNVRYLSEHTAKDGTVSYRYNPPTDAKKAGVVSFKTLSNKDEAIEYATAQNKVLDAWKGRSGPGKPGGGTKEKPKFRYVEPGTLTDFINKYRSSERYANLVDSTRKGYEKHMRWLEEYPYRGRPLGERAMKDINADMVDTVYSNLRKERSLVIANKIATMARLLWEIAVRQEFYGVTKNPWAKMKMRGTDPRQVRWTAEQIEQFVDKAFELRMPSVALCAVLCYEFAQRKVDMLKLKWDAYKDGQLFIRQGKRGARVWVPVPEHVQELLNKYRRGPTEYVCPDAKGRRYSEEAFAKAIREVREAANLPAELWISDLRRTATTELFEAGVSNAEAMAVTGHKNEVSLKPYRVTLDNIRLSESAMRKRQAYRKGAA